MTSLYMMVLKHAETKMNKSATQVNPDKKIY